VIDGKLRIESLARRHLTEVARLHVLGLSRDFSGWPGRQIMSVFYRELITTHDPPPGFVALVDDRVVGFAVAVADARQIKKRVLMKWWWWLALLGLVQFVVRPISLTGRAARWIRERRAHLPRTGLDPLQSCCPPPRIEFRGIVVDPAARVPGAALALMRARLGWAKTAGYRSIYFQIDHDNERSIQLCQWAGAQPVPEDVPRPRLRFYKVLS